MKRPWYEIAYLKVYIAVLVTLRRALVARPVEIFWTGCFAFLLLIAGFYTVDLLPISWLRSEIFSFVFLFYMTTCIVVALSSIFFALYRLIRKPATASTPRTQHGQPQRLARLLIKSTVPWCCALVLMSWLTDLSPLTTLRTLGWLPLAIGLGALIVGTWRMPNRR